MLRFAFRLLVLFSLFSFSFAASAATTQQRCGSTANVPFTVPTGWVLTNSYHSNNCPSDPTYPLLPNANEITEYDNLLVGTTLVTCNALPPANSGWTASGSSYNANVCTCPYANCTPFSPNVNTWTHNSCQPPQNPSTCTPPPPPNPTGQIFASAASVTIPYGQSTGSISVSWTSTNTSSVCIWTSKSGAAPTNWICQGASGSATYTGVPAGGYTKFFLSTNANGTAPNPVLSTTTVSGVAGAQPYIHPSGSIVVPHGATSVDTTFTWSAPGYAGLDWWKSTNNGPWEWSLNSVASGSAVVPVTAGQTIALRLYSYSSDPSHPGEGGTANVVASTTITGVSGAAPQFSAVPSQVIVPLGSTSGNTTIFYNAPGYVGLDWWLSTNGGSWQWAASSQAAGNNVLPVAVGTTYAIRFYPFSSDPSHPGEGGTANLLGTVTVTASH